eukprot:CAMPEP_0201917394 /NCGR_PEP_ID=MMETSP0903-20130614/6800_1 /ASSEMBLY_ACC=CAM_ASM_000552 /TAXON_ID=420261 /ORGANISM="Thalassiosira antarctica, Strain CCMP982" /LENGTH=36 /DNA_ID= /DNA_START= /DNA_END= /DNA_ORIENTATION=
MASTGESILQSKGGRDERCGSTRSATLRTGMVPPKE